MSIAVWTLDDQALDNGKSVRETRDADIPVVVRHLYHQAGWATLHQAVLPILITGRPLPPPPPLSSLESTS